MARARFDGEGRKGVRARRRVSGVRMSRACRVKGIGRVQSGHRGIEGHQRVRERVQHHRIVVVLRWRWPPNRPAALARRPRRAFVFLLFHRDEPVAPWLTEAHHTARAPAAHERLLPSCRVIHPGRSVGVSSHNARARPGRPTPASSGHLRCGRHAWRSRTAPRVTQVLDSSGRGRRRVCDQRSAPCRTALPTGPAPMGISSAHT